MGALFKSSRFDLVRGQFYAHIWFICRVILNFLVHGLA
jgi:hypothetical protein